MGNSNTDLDWLERIVEVQSSNSRTNQGYIEYIKKINDIKSWLSMHKIPKEMANRVIRYNDVVWKKFKGADFTTILADLPQNLRKELQTQIFKDLVDKVDIFPKHDIGAL